jgi:carboxyl-terminal processing protease
VQAYLAELLKRSNERIATNQDFVYIREDIEEFRKLQADKTFSLNEKKRLQEKEELEKRRKARLEEIRARKETNETVYEITLKQVDLPGLPPPNQKTNAVASASASPGGTTAEMSASAAATAPEQEEMDPEAMHGDEKLNLVDAELKEAQRILLDYISLLSRDKPLVARQ